MGSIIDYIDCPKCGREAYDEFHYKSGEEHIMCSTCGYVRDFIITNFEEKDGQSEFDWVPKYEVKEIEGFGSYRIRSKGGIGSQIGTFIKPDGDVEFKAFVEQNKAELDHASYTTYIDGVVKEYVVIQGDIEAMTPIVDDLNPADVEQSFVSQSLDNNTI